MHIINDWWRGAVFYQIYPRSFYDSNNDGIGDLNGITEKADYIASLGVDAVWLSPFFTSPMADFGYDVSDYQNVDKIFGTLEDFDRMLNALHQRGLKLIIDLVLNHTSERHPWFLESRQDKANAKADWYVWADPKPDGTPPNNWMSVFGGSAWSYDSKRRQYYYHQFLKQQPDLNLRNFEVQDKLLEIARWWLDKGVDGFRLDALNHGIHDALFRDNPPKQDIDHSVGGRQAHPYYWQRHLYSKTQPEMLDFIKRLRKLTDEYEGRMMVAEIGDDLQTKTSIAYTDGPEMLHTAYSFALLGPNTYHADIIRALVEEYFAEPSDSWPSWAFSNHDVVRVASRWAVDGKPDMRQAKMLIALLASLRGTTFIYQGEELGLEEADIAYEDLKDPFGIFLWPEDKGRDGCRTPFPWSSSEKHGGFSGAEKTWLPVAPPHLPQAVDRQEQDQGSVLHFTRHFLKWRRDHETLKTGELRFLEAKAPIIAFTRERAKKQIICVFNLDSHPAQYRLPQDCAALEGLNVSYDLQEGLAILPPFGFFFAKPLE